MDAEKILDYVKKRLEKIEEMEYSKHAEFIQKKQRNCTITATIQKVFQSFFASRKSSLLTFLR